MLTSAKHNFYGFVASFLSCILLASGILLPFSAYADDYGDGITTLDGKSKSVKDFDFDWEQYESASEAYANSGNYARYLTNDNTDNPYITASEIAQGGALLSTAVGAAVPASKPFAAALGFGFGFFSDWALSQDLTLAAAYGADYLLTDFLIQIYREGKAKWCEYDTGKTYTIQKTRRISNPVEFVLYGYDKWEEGYEDLRDFTPWAGYTNFIVPPASGYEDKIEEDNGKAFRDQCTEVLGKFVPGNAKTMAHYDPGRTSTSEGLRTRLKEDPNASAQDGFCHYGYEINEKDLSLDELSAIQAIIYHYCSSMDWRMMLAENYRRNGPNSQLSEADFNKSIQAAMGFQLADGWIDQVGLLIMGDNNPLKGHNIVYSEVLSDSGLVSLPWDVVAKAIVEVPWDATGNPGDAQRIFADKLASYGLKKETVDWLWNVTSYWVKEGGAEEAAEKVATVGQQATTGALTAVSVVNYVYKINVHEQNKKQQAKDIHDKYVSTHASATPSGQSGSSSP